MLDKIDLNVKIDKATYKRTMPALAKRLYAVQKQSWDAGIPVVILFEGWDAASGIRCFGIRHAKYACLKADA